MSCHMDFDTLFVKFVSVFNVIALFLDYMRRVVSILCKMFIICCMNHVGITNSHKHFGCYEVLLKLINLYFKDIIFILYCIYMYSFNNVIQKG